MDPEGTIQLRITIDSLDCEIGTTKISCKKSCWDAASQRLYSKYPESKSNNRKLNDISTALSRLYDVLNTKYEYVTPEIVKDYYLIKRKFTYSLQEIITAYIKHRGKEVDQKIISDSTLGVNKNYARHILDYSDSIKVKMPTHLSAVFFTDLFQFLLDDERCGERMARKVSCFAKQMLKWAKKKGMCSDLNCFDESLPGTAENEDHIDTTHLSINQLQGLYLYDFNVLVEKSVISKETAATLSTERNAFVFNCFTGMHHCDYSNKAFTVEKMYDSLFLKGKRKKTKKPFAIRLLEPAVHILANYDNDLIKLPIKSNQKRNQSLKLIALYVGIPLKLSTKVARKTFADLALNEMLMPADDVAACLGLTSTRYLKNYVRIREKRLLQTMKSSWEDLKNAS